MNTRKPVRATVMIEYDDDTTATLEVLAEDAAFDKVQTDISVSNDGSRATPQLRIRLQGAAGQIVGWMTTESVLGSVPAGPDRFA